MKMYFLWIRPLWLWFLALSSRLTFFQVPLSLLKIFLACSDSRCVYSTYVRIVLFPALRVRVIAQASRAPINLYSSLRRTLPPLKVHVHVHVLSNGSCMRSWHYKSPYQFCFVPVPWYCAVAVFLVCHNMDAPQHQALTLRTPQAVGSPLIPDPDQVSKHASLVPRPRV